jgi:hypothetical protein
MGDAFAFDVRPDALRREHAGRNVEVVREPIQIDHRPSLKKPTMPASAVAVTARDPRAG